MYYNQQGQPINIYGQLMQPSSYQTPPQIPPRRQPSTETWDVNLNSVQTMETTHTPQVPHHKFGIIDSKVDIQEIGNKYARLGETLYYINNTTGELYKKYVDFLSGLMVVESAKFSKVAPEVATKPTVEKDPRIDELFGKIKSLEDEVEDLKGAILNDEDNS